MVLIKNKYIQEEDFVSLAAIDSGFYSKEALLYLDLQKKVTGCSSQFLKLFGLKTLPIGTRFDEMFELISGRMDGNANWQPFCVELKSSGVKAEGIICCDKDGYRFIFWERGFSLEQPRTPGFAAGRLSLLFSHMREGVAIHRLVFKEGKAVDYIIEDMNESFAEMFGFEQSKANGQLASSLFGTKKAPFLNIFANVVKSAQPSQFDAFYSRLSRHFLISVTPWDECRFGTVVSDLSQSRYSQMLYKALNEAAADISNVVETAELFDGTAGALQKSGFECMLMLLDNDSLVTETYQSFGEPRYIKHAEQAHLPAGICAKAVRERCSAYIESLDIPTTLEKAGFDEGLKCIASPLIISGELKGIFVVLSRGLKHRDMDAVTAFANQLAAMMEKAALIKDLRAHIVKLEMSRKAHKDAAERLKLASSASCVGIWDIDLIRNYEYIDHTLEKIYGIEPGTFDGSMKSWRKYVHPDDIEDVILAFNKALNGDEAYSAEFRIILKDGSIRHISSTGMLHKDDNGTPVRMVGTDWDITERKKAELALMAEKELMAATLRSIGDGVVVTDRDGRITLVNAQFEQLCGLKRSYIHGCLFGEIVKTADGSLSDSDGLGLIEKTLRTGRIFSCSGRELLRKDGKIVPVAYTAAPIRDSKSDICGSVIVIRDITEEKKKQEKIDYLLYHDSLTGVYNRRYFDMMIKKYDTKDNLPISILSCDVNGLKLTNDAFGHSAGDRLLQRMAAIMEKAAREGDIVARVGGDEFLILMPRADEAKAKSICEKVKELAAKERKFEIDESISIGFETKYRQEENIYTVIKKAESKMYRVKTFEDPDRRDNSINTILLTLHQKRPHEQLHARQVSDICSSIARQMGLSKREISEIKVAGLMHDIGKIAVPEAIFNKPGSLTDEEWTEVRRHCEIGFRIISGSIDMAHIAKTVLAHHERYDGKGYPSGIRGEEIPLMARILAVADAYDAMTNERPFRKPFKQKAAIKEIADGSGTQFDPVVVEAFLKLMEKGGNRE